MNYNPKVHSKNYLLNNLNELEALILNTTCDEFAKSIAAKDFEVVSVKLPHQKYPAAHLLAKLHPVWCEEFRYLSMEILKIEDQFGYTVAHYLIENNKLSNLEEIGSEILSIRRIEYLTEINEVIVDEMLAERLVRRHLSSSMLDASNVICKLIFDGIGYKQTTPYDIELATLMFEKTSNSISESNNSVLNKLSTLLALYSTVSHAKSISIQRKDFKLENGLDLLLSRTAELVVNFANIEPSVYDLEYKEKLHCEEGKEFWMRLSAKRYFQMVNLFGC